MHANLWIGGFARILACATTSVAWIRRKALARATLGRAEPAERIVALLRDELAAGGAALAHLQSAIDERNEALKLANSELVNIREQLTASNTALDVAEKHLTELARRLNAAQTELAERDAALARANCEATEQDDVLERVSGEHATLNSRLAECEAALAEAGECADGFSAELQTARRLLAERDAELERTTGRLARPRAALKMRKRHRRDPDSHGRAPRGPRPNGEKEEIGKRPTSETRAFLKDDTWQLDIEDEFLLNGATSRRDE